MRPTLNCDMGESFGLYRCGDDVGVMPFIDLANVACGFHAGDPTVMRRTVKLAKTYGVRVGAHPSYPDLQGFGRREMTLERDELVACILYQVGALKAFLDAEGMPLNHLKPHGALYGAASRNLDVAEAVAEAAAAFGVPVMGLAGTLHETAYKGRGLPFIGEFYIDLDYADDGGLIITRRHDPIDPERAVARALRMADEGAVISLGGVRLPIQAESICLHSDTPNASVVARMLRENL